MKQTLLIIIATLFIVSCKDEDCEAFRLNHPVVGWHLFPDRLEQYVFTNDTLVDTLFRRNENVSGFEELRCYYCKCNQSFSSTYDIDETFFSSITAYNSLNDLDDSQITYSVSDQRALLYMTENGELWGEWSDGTPINDNLDYSVFDSLSLSGTIFHDILTIQFKDSIEIKRIWVEKGSGLVAYEKDNILFKKE